MITYIHFFNELEIPIDIALIQTITAENYILLNQFIVQRKTNIFLKQYHYYKKIKIFL